MPSIPETELSAMIGTLKAAQQSDDPETAHCAADDVLCNALRMLGYSVLADEWEKVRKWYA
jgi:hypothetical protein